MPPQKPAPLTFLFADDGSVPNNPTLPLVLYPSAIALAGARDPEANMEKIFKTNGRPCAGRFA